MSLSIPALVEVTYTLLLFDQYKNVCKNKYCVIKFKKNHLISIVVINKIFSYILRIHFFL